MPHPPMRAAIVPVTPLQQNCTLLWCTATMKAAVIDPGGDMARIQAALAHHGLTAEKILLTHGHIDHAGEAKPLADALGVPIEGPHEADRFWLSRLDEDGRNYGIRGVVFEPDRWLTDGETVTVGNLTLDVYHTPGHTPGHVIFHHAPSRFAQVGDVLFQGSIGRTDFPLGDHKQLIDSIVTKLWPLGDDTAFVPGHGPGSTFAHERRHNMFVSDRALAAQRGDARGARSPHPPPPPSAPSSPQWKLASLTECRVPAAGDPSFRRDGACGVGKPRRREEPP